VCMHAFFLALGSAEKEANWAHEYGIPHDGYTITDADTTTLYNAHTPTLQAAHTPKSQQRNCGLLEFILHC